MKDSSSIKFRRQTLTLIRLILKLLDQGQYPARIGRIVGRSRATIHYHVKRLKKMGYIELKSRDAITIYRVTQAGKSFLVGIESRVWRGRVLRLHNVYFKYPVLRQPLVPVVWRKVELTNWTQLVGTELGFRVRKNPRSVEVIAKVVEGKDPYELLLRARDEADRVAAHLESKFGMQLGRPRLSRRPHFGIYDRVAGSYSKYFQLSDDVAKIDESEGQGEIDWLDPEHAKEYLLMPGRVQQLERTVGEVNRRLQSLESGLTTILQTWNLVGNRLLELLARFEEKKDS